MGAVVVGMQVAQRDSTVAAAPKADLRFPGGVYRRLQHRCQGAHFILATRERGISERGRASGKHGRLFKSVYRAIYADNTWKNTAASQVLFIRAA